MKNMDMYIFAYGSLMNPRSRAKTLPGDHPTKTATLTGYRRKTNIVFDGYAYLNIVPDEKSKVAGTLIAVTKDELVHFVERERGYSPVDVRARLVEPTDRPVIAFIAPDIACDLPVPRSYLNTCTSGMNEDERATWIAETAMNGIFEDADAPVYENVAE